MYAHELGHALGYVSKTGSRHNDEEGTLMSVEAECPRDSDGEWSDFSFYEDFKDWFTEKYDSYLDE